MDLFEHYQELPENVREIIEKYAKDDLDYKDCENFTKELNQVGYTCDYDLSATCFDLKPITIEAYKELFESKLEFIENLIHLLPQKGDTTKECQRLQLQVSFNELYYSLNGTEQSDMEIINI